MCEVEQIVGVLFLMISACHDFKTYKIPIWLLVIATMATLSIRVIYEGDWWVYMAGLLLGGVFLLISKVTAEAFGYGDSALIMILGMLVGIWQVILVLIIAFATAAIFGAIVLIKKGMSKKQRFPFSPFLLIGFLGGCLL